MNCVVDYQTLEGRHSKIMLLTLTCSRASTPDGKSIGITDGEIHTGVRADKRNYILSAKKKKEKRMSLELIFYTVLIH